MKRKLFSLLALLMVAVTGAWADIIPTTYDLKVGTNAQGSVKFYVAETEVTKAAEGATVTVAIEPNTGWSVGGLQGLWYAAGSAVKAPKRIQSNIDMLKDFELEPVEGNPNAFTFVMKRANAEISVSYRKLLTHADISFEDIAAVTYTGQALTPAVTVKDGETVLTKDTDFSVSYESNENVGTGKATIVGIGKYSGQVEKTFTINKADITPTAPTAMTQLTFNGQAQTLVAAGSIAGPGNMEACEMQYSLDGQTYAKELPTATNAGSYTVFYKVVGDANHNGVEPAFINVAIYKAALTNVLLQASTLTYNQQEQSPVITSVKAGELVVPATDYTVSGSATNVGTYTMTVMAKESADNFTGTATAQYSIVAADANLFNITLGTSTFTFNGTELKPTVTVKDGEATLVENTDYTLAFTNNVNVGTATVTATGIGNYSGTKTATYDIIKADITPTAPTAQTGLVYTTQPQALIAAGQAQGGEMQYSLDNETWSTNIPTGTEAKEYTVYYKVVADANHNDVAAQNFKVTIEQATLTAATLTETNFIYNQQEQTALVAIVSAGAITVPDAGYEIADNKATNVGNYTATLTGKGNFKGSVTANWSIVAANANLFNITLGTNEYTYDGTAKTPTVTVKDGEATLVENTDYTLAYTANTNAGTATVTVTGKGNYSGTKTATFTIKTADITPTAPTAKTGLVFNALPQTLISAGSAEGGEMQYSLDNVNYSTSLPSGFEAKEYTVYYKVVADANHNDVAAQSFKVTIAQAELTELILAQTTLTYNQQEQTVAVASVKAGNLPVAADSYEVSGNKGTNVSEYTVTVTGKGNFKGQATAKFTIVPAEAEAEFEITLGTTEYIYDGTAKTPTVTVKDGEAVLVEGTDYTLAYTANTNAGTATVTATGKGNYSGTQTATFTIKQADMVITVPTVKEGLVYTTQPQALVNAGTVEGGELMYSLDNTQWTTTVPTGTEAKEYTVYYKIVNDANHKAVEPQQFKVTIEQATLTAAQLTETNFIYNQQEQTALVSYVNAGTIVVPATSYDVEGNKATNVGNYTAKVTGKGNFKGEVKMQWSIVAANANLFNISLGTTEYTYDGTAKTPTVTVKDGEAVLVEGTDYTLAYTANTNAGTATVTATGKGNYSGTQTATFTIKQADMVITVPTVKEGLVYTTQPQALVNAGSVEGGELFYSLDNQTWAKTVPTGTDAKEYTVYYKIEADANHKAVDPQNFKVTIDKATLTTTSLAETNFIYNKLEREAQVVYVNAGTIVVPATSYDVEGNKATNVGNYEAKVTGKGNFKGEVKVQWSIVAANAQLFDLTLGTTEYTYDGTAKTPAVTVKDGSAVLVEGTDYTLAYTANTNAGTATVTATGKGNYSGTQTATFTIKPATLTSVTLEEGVFQYNLFTPVAQTVGIVEVKAGNLTVPAAQYEVEGNTQTEPGEYIVTVTGKTNFQGSVTAKFVILDQVVDGDATKTETEEEVDDVDMTVSVVDRSRKTLKIDEITEGATTSGEDITVTIPATINGWEVVSVGANAMSGLNNVTDIIMPDTEKPIEIEAGAFPGTATIHTTLAMLDDYALMASLQQNYEATKVVCTVTPANKYWTLGTGCDVIIPDGIDVYTVQVKNTAEVATEIIPEEMLKRGNERIIKANNGVLLLGTAGQSYDLVAYSGRIASGMPVATSDNKDYGQKNCLEPVIEKKHYDSGHYFVLQNNEFHSILAEGDEVKVPAGKAVLHLGNEQAGANARVLKIDAELTGITTTDFTDYTDGVFYDLNGRKLQGIPTKKGVYILNGKKVVVK